MGVGKGPRVLKRGRVWEVFWVPLEMSPTSENVFCPSLSDESRVGFWGLLNPHLLPKDFLNV